MKEQLKSKNTANRCAYANNHIEKAVKKRFTGYGQSADDAQHLHIAEDLYSTLCACYFHCSCKHQCGESDNPLFIVAFFIVYCCSEDLRRTHAQAVIKKFLNNSTPVTASF